MLTKPMRANVQDLLDKITKIEKMSDREYEKSIDSCDLWSLILAMKYYLTKAIEEE
jgi:hypothetical protein